MNFSSDTQVRVSPSGIRGRVIIKELLEIRVKDDRSFKEDPSKSC